MSKVRFTEIHANTDVLQTPVLQREDLQPVHLAMYGAYEALRSYIHRFLSFSWEDVSCVKPTDHWQIVCLVAVRPLLSYGTCITLHVQCTAYLSVPTCTSPLFEALPPTL